ncbi:MAG TPA: gamma carbonic anhydrase family protein [Thiotrichales bacterium]|nr:gamma carbonic anhydrase family protein [Thiotrichales bacterium]
MKLRPFDAHQPQVGREVYIDPTATVIGRVRLGDGVSVWPHVVIRGDVNSIEVGARTNIQDGSILHVTHPSEHHPEGYPLRVGSDVTVGHRVILHGCTVGDHCLIGMGAIVMDGVEVEPWTIVGAGSLVPGGKRLEGKSLWLGSPVRKVRALSLEELEWLDYSARHYLSLSEQYRNG